MASMNNQGASSSSATSDFVPYSWSYDVFLSFRGEDTRYGFTGHLHSALLRKGINTFIDNDLTRGDEIAQSLLKVIEESRISVIVFSEDYASSKWCLDELVHIHHCNESKQQMVRPVFYKVDPADVRYQKGSYGEALAKHERRFPDNLEKVGRWRTALTRSANLSGWHYKEQDYGEALAKHERRFPDNLEKVGRWRRALTRSANLSGWHYKEKEYESTFIDNIVEEISLQLLNQTYLDVAEYPIGIDSRVQVIDKLLSVSGNSRCIIGIWGSPGIGKTTIAKAVYNSIAHRFEGRCFLENVGENSESPEGLVQLLETLLVEILGGPNWKLTSVDKGINVIKQRLANKRVLIVLDDVNKLDWLSKLAGATGLFGEGSRVILTTRYKGSLTRHGVKLVYEVKKLDHQQALELFSWHAFGKNEPPYEYVALASHAVDYVQCLPLALKVLGSHLGTLETADRWQATLDSYKSAPYKEIQKPFRICYDALEYEVKEVFLDIACFFNHKEKEFVLEILKDDDLDVVENYINVLIQSTLITVDRFKRISMHNLLEQMGKDIARQESVEPGECRRVWFHKDVFRILTENSGTHKIEGIMVKFPLPDEIPLNAKSFSGMRNLKYFINCNACLSGYVDYLPNSLKLIDWGRCELKSFPSNFQPKELIVLNMPYSRIAELGKAIVEVTSLNFDNCKFLKKVPSLSGIPNIKSLSLGECTNLVEVDPTVGFLEKLVTLDLNRCSNLTKFPTRVCWKSLKDLILLDCKRLKKFPEIVDKMESLDIMQLRGTGIKELPSSIRYLTQVSYIGLDRCQNLTSLPSSIYELQHLDHLGLNHSPKLITLPSKATSEVSSSAESLPLALTYLSFEGCNLLSDIDLSVGLHCVSTLKNLDLSESSFVSLPKGISKFVNLKSLKLCGCKRLRAILELPPFTRFIEVADCISLEAFSLLSEILENKDTQLVYKMDLSNCHRLIDNLGLDVAKIANVLLNEVEYSLFEVLLPGNKVPQWFNYHKDICVVVDEDQRDPICEILIEIPQHFISLAEGLTLCAVFEITEKFSGYCNFGTMVEINELSVKFYDDCVFQSREVESAHVWLKYIPFDLDIKSKLNAERPSMPCMFRVVFHQKLGKGLLYKSCGVYLAGMPRDGGDQDEDDDNDRHHEQEQSISLSIEATNHPNDSRNYEDEDDDELCSCFIWTRFLTCCSPES
ncbi:TMV resistance protein N isoform X2 [Rosa chinensis]|uniref:TMV resistance protein N isoform X2 n=1 Tax=Rosa chinensis TaxID=74649 RepID=UPI001AD8E72D|nr:TMV resistance protein N isoform X2 [Rosa chinensis]